MDSLKNVNDRKYYERKVPAVLSAPLKLSECDLYAVLIETKTIYREDDVIFNIWKNMERWFGVFSPKGIEKLESFNLFTVSGEFSVRFLKVRTSQLQVDFNVLKNYHKYICTQFFTEYVHGELVYADQNEDVLKGLIVPLKANVVEETLNTGNSLSDSEILRDPIDYDEIKNTMMEIHINRKKEGNITSCPFSTGQILRKTYIQSENDKDQAKNLYYFLNTSSKKGSDHMKSGKTFKKYYQEKHNIDIDDDTHLINVTNTSMKFVSFETCDDLKRLKKNNKALENLVPQLCEIALGMSSDLHVQANMLPYILYKMEALLNATELKNGIAKKIRIREIKDCEKEVQSMIPEHTINYSTSEILAFTEMSNLLQLSKHKDFSLPSSMEVFEALTTRQASFGANLERLELLGDAFLKQAVTVYLFFKHFDSTEGELTRLRTNCVNNNSLGEAAKKLQLQHFINNSNFSTKDHKDTNKNPSTVWLPPLYKRELKQDNFLDGTENQIDDPLFSKAFQEIQDKSLADCVEALIGVYFKCGGVNLALYFINDVLGIPCLNDSETIDMCIENGKYSNFRFPLSEDSNKDNSLLMQLFNTRGLSNIERSIDYTFADKSHLVRAMTHPSFDENAATRTYQEYEYLGDAVLDFLVTVHVYVNNPNLSPGALTDVKSALVNNNTFAFLAIKLNLSDLLLQNSSSLFFECRKFMELCQQCYECKEGGTFDDLFESPFIVVPPESHEGFMAPKVLGDLIESLAGAIFLDSGLDLIKVWQVFYPIMQPIIDAYSKEIPKEPKRHLLELYPKAKFQYPEEAEDPKTCTVKYGINQSITGVGKNRRMATSAACFNIIKKCKQHQENENK